MFELGSPMELLHGPDWKNRVTLAPMTNRQSHADGTVSAQEIEWLQRRADGGFGLVMTAAANVSANGLGWTGQLGIWDDAQLPGLTALAAALRQAGARSSIQLHHGGLRAEASVVGDLVAPWEDVETGARAVTTAEVEGLIEDFISAAGRAETAGFDGVEIHGAHGYLIAQFLDSTNNHRVDGYGSTYDGRARFLREVTRGIRVRTGIDFQVGLRLSPERYGIRLVDALNLAQEMMLSGELDYLDMSLWDVFKTPHESQPEADLLISQFTALDRGTTRLGVAGKIYSAADAQACLELGADFISVGSAGILHHDFAAQIIAEPGFVAVSPPVTTGYLKGESVSQIFIEYLTEIKRGWFAGH